MKSWHLDWRSLVVGLLLGVCLVLGMGAAAPDRTGRYQISAIGYPGNDAYVIDTGTGQVWHFNPPPPKEWVKVGRVP